MYDVSALVRTEEDVREAFSVIDSVVEDLFKVNHHINVPEKYSRFLVDVGVDLSDLGNGTSLARAVMKDKLLELKAQLQDLTVLHVTLAFDPPREFVNSLFEWFRRNGFSDIVLKIKVEPELIGGIVFSYKGFNKDFSLLTRLNSYFNDMSFDKSKSFSNA